MSAQRGHLKIFFGMAAGVGKTYRMLQEGYAAAQAGRDVAIGLLETHGRSDIERLARGMTIVPRRKIAYRGMEVEEMDLPGVLARSPELCLIDELAHTNVPGVEHSKRYEDVEEVLAAGIDVYSTLNVQHLESLNDRITELSGVRVREEVEVKRLTAEAPPARAESLATEAPQAVSDRVLALVQPRPSAQRLVRRAWRSAQRLGAELELLWVKRPGENESDELRRALGALRQLAAVLGASLHIEESDDLAGTVADFAKRHNITYILLGAPRVSRGISRLKLPLPLRLLELLPGVDVRMVANRAQRRSSEQIQVERVDRL
jgi:two-component system sensor histidine kinase KdpD